MLWWVTNTGNHSYAQQPPPPLTWTNFLSFCPHLMFWYSRRHLSLVLIFDQFLMPFRCVCQLSSQMHPISSILIVITISTTAKHFERPCASWWIPSSARKCAMSSFPRGLMVLIAMIDMPITTLCSLMWVTEGSHLIVCIWVLYLLYNLLLKCSVCWLPQLHSDMFYDWGAQINLKGLDGIQGPVYVGTGCVFRRQALYGYEAPYKGGKPPKSSCGSCCPSWCCGSRKKAKKPKSSKKKGALRSDSTIPIFSLEDIEEGVEGKDPIPSKLIHCV